jgi:hypothetical protein
MYLYLRYEFFLPESGEMVSKFCSSGEGQEDVVPWKNKSEIEPLNFRIYNIQTRIRSVRFIKLKFSKISSVDLIHRYRYK